MKKWLTTENLVSFGIAVLAGFVAIAIFNRLPAGKVKSLITGA